MECCRTNHIMHWQHFMHCAMRWFMFMCIIQFCNGSVWALIWFMRAFSILLMWVTTYVMCKGLAIPTGSEKSQNIQRSLEMILCMAVWIATEIKWVLDSSGVSPAWGEKKELEANQAHKNLRGPLHNMYNCSFNRVLYYDCVLYEACALLAYNYTLAY